MLEHESSSQIKIIDLGLSQINDKAKPLKSERGSIHYLAPEILRNNYDHKVDIWAAGVIFYVLLTGNLPFHAEKVSNDGQTSLDTERIKELILEAHVDYSLREFQMLDPIFENLIRHMLHKDPQRRPEATQLLSLPFFRSGQTMQLSTHGRNNFSAGKCVSEYLSNESGVLFEKRDRAIFCELF